jgi:hypothetical protein
MCGRFTYRLTWEKIVRLYGLTVGTLRNLKPAARHFAVQGSQLLRRRLAQFQRRVTIIGFAIRQHVRRHRRLIGALILLALIAASAGLAPSLQKFVGGYFDADRFAALRNLLTSTGGALIGATAIGFSVVMIAVQLNFARIPQGLFRKLSSDFRLLGAFAATFMLAIVVAGLSLMPDASWSAGALIGAGWATLLILILFFYGYRRALALINPGVQIGLIVSEARRDLRRWMRRAQRMAPLVDAPKEDGGPTHDLPRLAFFRANAQWTRVARQAVSNAVSFARRYAEQGDYEVAGSALTAVVVINAEYIAAKGKTFFAPNPIFDIPLATDGFINETLEHLRRAVQAATTRHEEEPLRQLLAALSALVRTYIVIDYSNPRVDSKHHAQLAAAYLAGAVEAVLPQKMPDVLMEGVRLMGVSAQAFLAVGEPNGVLALKEKIAALSCAGAVKPEFRPVTLVGMEQLARMTLNLLRLPSHDIGYAVEQVRNGVELVVKFFLQVPDAPLERIHSTYLGPYYSLTSRETLGSWLTDLCNAVIEAQEDDAHAKAVVSNIESWSEELNRTEKSVMLLAIEKRSPFTFDILHWIAHVTKLLTAVAKARVTDDHYRDEIEKHASWLISVLSWIPEDRESTGFVEGFSPTRLMFEAAFDAFHRNSERVAESARRVLVDWTFKAARNPTGWGTLETGLRALVTLVLSKDVPELVIWLKTEITKQLAQENPLDTELLDRTARNLRRTAISFRRREFEFDPIDREMGELDPGKLRALLTEVADMLSPNTASEPVEPDWF